MQVKIRKAMAADALEIADLLRSLDILKHMVPESDQKACEHVQRNFALSQADRSHSIYVAHDPGGLLVGYGAVHWLPYLIFTGPEGFVSELFVREDYCGQGVGTSLLEAITTEAIERGCCRLGLLNIRDRESYQRSFYPKHGWIERTEASNFVYHLPITPR